MNKFGFSSVLILCFMLVSFACGGVGAADDSFTIVVDSRGVEVKVPKEIHKIITISDGLVESTLIAIGEIDKLAAVGSQCLQKNYDYDYPSVKGDTISRKNGMNTAAFLNKRIMELPLIANWNTAPNFEKIAALNPDLIIIRIGSCWMWRASEEVPKALKTLEDLGIPVIVLKSPQNYDPPTMSHLSDEIRIIGRAFGKEDKADALAQYLESQMNLVFERTKNIPEDKKPRVLLFGLSPRTRESGGAGDVLGLDTSESYALEEIVHARNAFQEKGSQKTFTAEHVLALDPDVILLPTDWGYHPPEELLEAPYYRNLQELRAVKNGRVAALPWTPCNCDRRIEYPIDIMVMAKAAYPELFQDINLADWLHDFYRKVYGVDDSTADELLLVQFMEWTLQKQ